MDNDIGKVTLYTEALRGHHGYEYSLYVSLREKRRQMIMDVHEKTRYVSMVNPTIINVQEKSISQCVVGR